MEDALVDFYIENATNEKKLSFPAFLSFVNDCGDGYKTVGAAWDAHIRCVKKAQKELDKESAKELFDYIAICEKSTKSAKKVSNYTCQNTSSIAYLMSARSERWQDFAHAAISAHRRVGKDIPLHLHHQGEGALIPGKRASV